MMKLNVFHYLPEEAKAIRIAVFCEEQGFQEEFDELDEKAFHVVACDDDNTPMGTCRYFPTETVGEFLIGRIAVLPAYRKMGVGAKLVREAERHILYSGGALIHIGAQVQAMPFYQRLGYTPVGERYMDEHVEHQGMEKRIRDYTSHIYPLLDTIYTSGAIRKISPTYGKYDPALYRNLPSLLTVEYRDGSVYQWHCENITSYNTQQFGISVSRDGRYVFAQSWEKGLFCYHAKTGALAWRTKRRLGITNVHVNEHTLVVHQHDKALQLLDMETGEVIAEKKPARAWGFQTLDENHILCHTTARNWEIIRTTDLVTVENIPHKKFPAEPWYMHKPTMANGKIFYTAACDAGKIPDQPKLDYIEGFIEITYPFPAVCEDKTPQ